MQVKNSVMKASPIILAILGAGGVVATAFLAVKATPKAIKLIEADSQDNHDGDPHAATKMEAIKSCWKCYIPAAATGVATIVCIFGANAFNRRQQASIASAYALVSRQFHDYKGEVIKRYGKEAHNDILDCIAVEKSSAPVIYTTGLLPCSSSSLEFEGVKEEEHLFYDTFSGRYFSSTIGQVLQAEYHLNRNFAIGGGWVHLNQFYEFLGIDPIPSGDDIGWYLDDSMCWIDFDHYVTKIDDGPNGEVECCVIEMVYEPQMPSDD